MPTADLTLPAMVLAAGRGERMRPLSDQTPKPLLSVHGKPLLAWTLEALAHAGVRRLVINTAWLGEQIPPCLDRLFDTHQPALHIQYSAEGADFGAALETLGGIVRALPHLGPVFWLAAGDVYAPSFPFSPDAVARFRTSTSLAHLWLVPNPEHHPRGDFGLSASGLALNLPTDSPQPRYTYSTIALFKAELFAPPWCDIAAGNPQGLKAPLAPLLRQAMDQGRVSAELWHGPWTDVGTPERLAHLETSETAP